MKRVLRRIPGRQELGLVMLVLLCLCMSSCGLSNLRSEQADLELQELNEKVTASQSSSAILLSRVEQLLAQQGDVAPRLDTLQAELNAIKAQQLQTQQYLQQEKSPALPVQKPESNYGSSKLMVGRVEWLWLAQPQRYFAAQLNTGQELSVVYVSESMPFERDGKRWLRFTIERNDWPSEISAQIKQSGKFQQVGGNTVRGHIVSMPVQLGSFNDELEFIVLEKKQNYPQVILGKNFLTDIAVVDVSEKYRYKKSPEAMRIEATRKAAYEEEKKAAEVPDEHKQAEQDATTGP